MKTLALSLILLAAPARAAEKELWCEPDARLTFESRWLRAGVVHLEGSLAGELPWTGHEPAVPAAQLPTEANALPEGSLFMAFGSGDTPSLYVARELLLGNENDGIVVAASPLQIFHCRSR